MCTHPKCKRLVATIVEEELELVAPFLPVNRHQERAAKFEQRREQSSERPREKVKGCNDSSCKCNKRAGSWVWVKWSSSFMYLYCIFSLSLIIWTSPMDVSDLPNHVKYCVPVCLVSNGQLSEYHQSVHRGAGIPNNCYQSIWFKVVFDFCSKMKVVKIVFWQYHCVKEEETKPLVKTALKSDVGNVLTRHHAPTRLLAMRPDARHASHTSSSPGWADPTMWLTRIRMTSAWHKCDVSMHSRHAMSTSSQLTRQHNGTHLPRHQPQAESSRAELELSREPRDRIQCSWSYVQSDLRLNLGRSSGQNCFDQILAIWNAIWTISDLFSDNLIVPNAMVRYDCWDLWSKVVVVN